MPDKKSRGVSNTPVFIQDVPDAPTVSASNVGTSRPYNNGAATVTLSSPTGGLPTSYSITTTPSTTTTAGVLGANTITGLSSATSYTVSATATNGSGVTSSAGTSGAFTATTVPQAPTIGTATDAGTGGAVSVGFTAGATGGSAITGYTATSSPGSITGTASSSPITVSGLTNNTAYTFTVTATNANGTSSASSASNSVTPTVPAFESIATVTVGAGGLATATFSSIPQTYKHLQIRMIARNANTAVDFNNVNARFNSDTGANYTVHNLYTFGSTPGAAGSSGNTSTSIGLDANDGCLASAYAVSVCDILDYTDTNKYTTIRALAGLNTNTTTISTQGVYFRSGLWTSTNAVTQIDIFSSTGNNWKQYTTFALYGIKG